MKTEKLQKRCAIYSRKSSDEGLDQDFNSLDAQREAAEHHIRAQAHEGWTVLPDKYDDGGFSGGSMERPALRRLIQDIEAGKIDVIVVYKIDRLSRSMADFMKIMEVFDRHKVSFVSVTQHFNTDTSMGRLILNILQSFAQFEREMTTERIRDKFAASKRKGMWMGGVPPLGYDVRNRKLEENPAEAEIVRYIFRRYLELGSATLLIDDLAEKGYKSKSWTSGSGRVRKGQPILKSGLYQILGNPIYIGKIRHKDKIYDGEHKGIIDPALFEQVRNIMATRAPNSSPVRKTTTTYLLRGLVFDPDGYAMTCGACKGNGRRYKYYVSTQAVKNNYAASPIKSVSGEVLESAIITQLRRFLSRPAWAVKAMEALKDKESGLSEQQIFHALEDFDALWDELFPAEQQRLIQLLIQRIVVHKDRLQITLHPTGMASLLHEIIPGIPASTKIDHAAPVTFDIPIQFKIRGGRRYIMTPNGQDIAPPKTQKLESNMIKVIIQGHGFQHMLDRDPDLTVMKLAERKKLDHGYIAKSIRMTQLAPDIIEAILAGRQSQSLTLADLMRPFPDEWQEQRQYFGF